MVASVPASRVAVLVLSLAMVCASAASAEAQDSARRVRLEFTPTDRVQLAIWVESEDGAVFQTLFLTDAVAYRGIGNRPGALQMNSAWHWPWGRREGVLPIWAHRRAETSGTSFPRVIFSGRSSEGYASVSGDDVPNTPDNYYCLSFTSGDEALDSVSCASVFMSNKGRYLTDADVSRGYAEPWEDAGVVGSMRSLSLRSLYPPRRDLADCGGSCRDHPDASGYRSDSYAAMPELDAVTMATLTGGIPFSQLIDIPDGWPDGAYRLFIEANTEGDYATGWDADVYPTPTTPEGRWDGWAIRTGYPYRGQPSVVYEVPFEISQRGGEWAASRPIGVGDLHGLDGELRSIDTLPDTPREGSAADRLLSAADDMRVRVVVPTINVCDQPDAPPECGAECSVDRPCGEPLICSADNECVGLCDVPMSPAPVPSLVAESHSDESTSHLFSVFRFIVPESTRGIERYEVRVATSPITDLPSFRAARPAKAAHRDDMALIVPIDGAPGSTVEVEMGGFTPDTHYWVGIRAFDTCNAPGGITFAEFTTTPIHFTTVSPCFVSTAAYGSPLDARIRVLRRFRDRHLRASAPGRALVAAYHTLGPSAATWIADDEDRRAAAREALTPLVALAEWLER